MSAETELTCTQCGQPEAHAVGDEILCASCCHQRASCGAVREATEPGDQIGRSDENRNSVNAPTPEEARRAREKFGYLLEGKDAP